IRIDVGGRYRDSKLIRRSGGGLATSPAEVKAPAQCRRAYHRSKGGLMRTIAFLTQKGGAGKTTLAASLAEVAASTGEKVIALDLDPQQSLVRWGKRRESANARNKIIVEPLECERLPRLRAILEGLAGAGFTLAIFDTICADGAAVRPVSEVADLSLLPPRPTLLDVGATATTLRAVFRATRN